MSVNYFKFVTFVFTAFYLFALSVNAYAQMGEVKKASNKELKEYGWDSSKFKHAHNHADTTGTSSYILIKDNKIIDMYGDITHKYRSHSVRKSFLMSYHRIHKVYSMLQEQERRLYI